MIYEKCTTKLSKEYHELILFYNMTCFNRRQQTVASKVTTNTLNLSGDRVITLSQGEALPYPVGSGWKDAWGEENEHLMSETCAQTTADNSF